MSLITVIGRGHSGTRAISETLSASGVFMGAPLNGSWDLVPPESMYEACREFASFVDWFGGLEWNWDRALASAPTERFRSLVGDYLRSVLESGCEHRGWKLPETTLCFPWITRLFPDAKYIFWIRNPRDCVIGGHVTDDMRRFGILHDAGEDVRLQRATSWKYQFDLVDAMPKPAHWLEVRFEDFVLDQEQTLKRLEAFLGIPLVRIAVRPEAVGRWCKDDADPETGPNYFDFFEPAMRRYGYELPSEACSGVANG